jgi:hypothetical protein
MGNADLPTTLPFHCDAHRTSGMTGTISITTPVELQSFGLD